MALIRVALPLPGQGAQVLGQLGHPGVAGAGVAAVAGGQADRLKRHSRRERVTGDVRFAGHAINQLDHAACQQNLLDFAQARGITPGGQQVEALGGYDAALWQASRFLRNNHIHFQPGINEDQAATAVWGSQQVNLHPGARYDGVFGIWYGKAPGVDRAADAIRHGNYVGTDLTGTERLHGASPAVQTADEIQRDLERRLEANRIRSPIRHAPREHHDVHHWAREFWEALQR